jgi:hypothetical protein
MKAGAEKPASAFTSADSDRLQKLSSESKRRAATPRDFEVSSSEFWAGIPNGLEYAGGREDLVIEVHAPHGKLHGIKDFFIHLFTITIGLLIALGLEGLVESAHHRHLAHQAEAGLHTEIAHNEQSIAHQLEAIKNRQKQLKKNQEILAAWRANPDGKTDHISLGWEFENFDDMSWKNSQITGAVAYMPYKDAQDFSDIYLQQDALFKSALQLSDELANSASLFVSHPDNWIPSPAQIDIEADRMGRAQVRLIILASGIEELDKAYKKFEAEHK